MANLLLASRIQSTGDGVADLSGESDSSSLVVVKKVSDSYSTNVDFVKMFKREAEISLLAKHPNLVRALETGISKSEMFIVLEYIDGITLNELRKRMIDQEGSINLNLTFYVLKEISRGLSFLHNSVSEANKGASIIHLDVSPQNVMIGRRGEVKLIDFGISKSTESKNFNQLRSVNGKLAYMSPEQARGERLTPASDIFSLGLMLIEMTTGQAVFQGQGKTNIKQTLTSWTVASFEDYLKLLPVSLAPIAKAMLDPMPENRPRASVLVQVFQNTLFLFDPKYNGDSFQQEISKWMDSANGASDQTIKTTRERTSGATSLDLVRGVVMTAIESVLRSPQNLPKLFLTTAIVILVSVGISYGMKKRDFKSKGRTPTAQGASSQTPTKLGPAEVEPKK
ncbi:MAG: serine/threonine protein kinase [Bdellovibrionales bacterium]|nr:serine/threonine protein kinase [Bdellovibrionales bacterium]